MRSGLAHLPHLGAVAAAALATSAAPSASPPAPPPDDGLRLSSLDRIVRIFDFEEAALAPIDFPLDFVNRAERDGRPAFGRMSLRRSAPGDGPEVFRAASGDWAFEFELDVVSLVAAVPTGKIPILPYADYEISVLVRTEGMERAAVRLAAALHESQPDRIDDPRPVIAESMARSPLVRSEGRWTRLSVVVPGDHPQATDLSVELQVLQPTDFEDAPHRGAAPRALDVGTRAWFDRLVVMMRPRLELDLEAEANVASADGEPPALLVLARDLSNDPLSADIRVEDLAGRTVLERPVSMRLGGEPVRIPLAIDRLGWFHATLTAHDRTGVVAERRLAFALVPDRDRRTVRRHPRFGVLVPWHGAAALEHAGRLVRAVEADAAMLVLWDEGLEADSADARLAGARIAFETLVSAGVEPTFALKGVPTPAARALGVDEHDVPRLLQRLRDRPLREWPDALRDLQSLLLDFGLRIERWRIGGVDPLAENWGPPESTALRDGMATLRPIVVNPEFLVPAPLDAAWRPPAGVQAEVVVPAEISADAVGAAIAPILADAPGTVVHLATLPPDRFRPVDRALDLARRALEAWRAGARELVIDAPWSLRDDPRAAPMPEPEFVAWRGVAAMLSGRRFAGTLPADDDVELWLARGEDGRDDAIVAWRNAPDGADRGPIEMTFSAATVTTTDCFGNAVRVAPRDGRHVVELDAFPREISGIDLDLALFRTRLALDPASVSVVGRVQEHALVVHNPWSTTLAGTIVLDPPAGIDLAPRRFDFLVPAGQSQRLPAAVSIDRAAEGGLREIPARVRLEADRMHEIATTVPLEIGWENIEVTTTWRIVEDPDLGRRDLVVRVAVANRSDRAIEIEAFLRAPGYPRMRRTIGVLGPNDTTARLFRLEDGAALLAGRAFRVGVAELDGPAQLNRMVQVPVVDAP